MSERGRGRRRTRGSGWPSALALIGVVALVTACSSSGSDGAATSAATSATSAASTTLASTVAASTTATTAPATTAPATTVPPISTTAPRPTLEQLLQRGKVNIAHAGGELEGPSETIFTFRQALANGADVLEMNLQLSSDGQLVLHHDGTVDRTTNGSGEVKAKTAAELGALDAAYWWVPEVGTVKDRPVADYRYRGVRTGEQPPPAGARPEDFGVPTFQQVVDAFPGVVLDLEMEAEAGPAVVPALVKAIQDNQLEDRVVVASFDDALMEAFRQQLPGVPASPGIAVLTKFYGQPGPLPGYRILQVPPKFGDVEVLTDAFIAGAKANGLLLWVWPNDSSLENAASYQGFLERGVNGMIADRPSVMATLEQ